MPCPVRWMKCSPQPASVITPRALASISSAVTPGRTPAVAAACACCRTPYHSATSAPGSRPTAYVRVQSERYPLPGSPPVPTTTTPPAPRRAPASDDDNHPRLDHPAGDVVVRVGPVGPRADDREVDRDVPLGE